MELSGKMWNQLTEKIGSSFRLTHSELEKLKENNVAKLIAAIPFNAECENMERTSLSHMSTYMLAKDPACKSTFGHNETDDSNVLKRIKPLNTFQGGIEAIINRGTNLLALIQLEDHQHDLETDKKENKYNPILAGIWNYTAQRKQLITAIGNSPCPAMDKVMTVENVNGFWNAG